MPTDETAITDDEARRIILHVNFADPQAHTYVLNNPGLTGHELATLLRSGGVTGAFVQAVCKRPKLRSDSMVREALLVHPLTPIPVATQLVGLVSMTLVRKLVKRGNLRAPILAACRRRIG